MIDLLSQIWITMTGATALWLVNAKRDRTRRWGPVFGICSQPAWYIQMLVHGQWFMLPVYTLYTGAWVLGIYNHWLKPAKRITEEPAAAPAPTPPPSPTSLTLAEGVEMLIVMRRTADGWILNHERSLSDASAASVGTLMALLQRFHDEANFKFVKQFSHSDRVIYCQTYAAGLVRPIDLHDVDVIQRPRR